MWWAPVAGRSRTSGIRVRPLSEVAALLTASNLTSPSTEALITDKLVGPSSQHKRQQIAVVCGVAAATTSSEEMSTRRNAPLPWPTAQNAPSSVSETAAHVAPSLAECIRATGAEQTPCIDQSSTLPQSELPPVTPTLATTEGVNALSTGTANCGGAGKSDGRRM